MRLFKKLCLTVAITALSASAGVAQEWILASPYPENSYMTVNNRAFTDDVRELTDDKLNITMHAGASLYPLPQIKPAVQSGQIQMGEVIQGAMANEDPIFGISMIPFLTRDIEDAKLLWIASRPAVEAVLEKQGVKLLHGVIWPGQSILTNRPVDSFSDLSGTKFRVQSPATGRLAELMGVTGVRVETADIPQAFLTRIIDGMFTSNETTANLAGWDYVDYAYQTNAWYPKNLTFISLDLWNSLDPEVQKVIETASANAETRGWAMEADKTAAATATLAEKGVEILEPSEELMTEFQAIGETMLKEWLEMTGEQGQKILDDYNQSRGM